LAAQAAVRTEATRQGRDLTFATTVELRAPTEQRVFTLRLRDWPGEVSLEVPAGVKRGKESYRRVGGRREWSWAVTLPAGEAKPVRLVVRGKARPARDGEGMALPDVWVAGVAGEQVVANGRLTKIDEDKLYAEIPVAVARFGKHLKFEEMVQLRWPVS